MTWVVKHFWRLHMAFWLGLAGLSVAAGDWHTAVAYVIVAAAMFQIDKMLDRAFAAGWRACANRADDLIKERITDDQDVRILLYYTLVSRIPSRRSYETRWDGMLHELALMENPSNEDLQALYRRYHPEP